MGIDDYQSGIVPPKLQGGILPQGYTLDRNAQLQQALSQTMRRTPVEDVVDAATRLNAALEAASRAGWVVTVVATTIKPGFAGEESTYQQVGISISKDI